MKFGSVYIAGHRGLVGSALLQNLQRHGYRNLIVRTHIELELRNSENVREFFAINKPNAVVVAAARVGGIKVAALIRKVHEAKMQSRRKVVIWGTGTPRREFGISMLASTGSRESLGVIRFL
jgi:NAD dependent epimerase/dehydratase family